MDPIRFGKFIAELRKENHMTQMQLAEKLHVTDKAVSRWERGHGFPDINTIEPLAEVLGVSVLEIMRAERITLATVSGKEAEAVLIDSFELVRKQRKIERRNAVKMIIGIAGIITMVFLIDNMGWLGFCGVCIPVICLIGGIFLLFTALYRRKNKLPCLQTVIFAIVLLLVPAIFIIMLFLVGVLGIGPVPS